jgi:hypothetical protein
MNPSTIKTNFMYLPYQILLVEILSLLSSAHIRSCVVCTHQNMHRLRIHELYNCSSQSLDQKIVVPFFKLFRLSSCKNIPKSILLCNLTCMNLLPPIPPQPLAFHILFACVFNGCSPAPQPCPCMLVAFNNATTFYIQTHFISKHSSKAMFASLIGI